MPDPGRGATGRTLLVVGGTGFFGKSILDAFRRGLLARSGIVRVVAAARRPETLLADCPDLVGPGVELVELDVARATELPAADVVIHAANTSDARRYAADPLAERAAILAAADNFARAAASADRGTRIVYASSGAVYGAQPASLTGLDEDRRPCDVAALAPYKRDYAEAKLLAERTIARLGSAGGMRVAVARCFVFVGAYLPRDRHFAVGNFLADGLAGRPIAVNARHRVIRSYLYADDLVEWLMTIAADASPACPIYNVGSDEAVDVADLAERVATLYGVDVRLPARSREPIDRYVPSIDRARSRLGLTVRHDLQSALAATARHIGSTRPAPTVGAAA